MTTNKTRPTTQNVTDFLNTVENDTMRADSLRLRTIFEEQSGFEAKMWGENMVGVGQYHYRYKSGHEGDMFLAGFSPRKGQFSVYLTIPSPEREAFLERLGKHKAAKSCIYIKKLADIDESVLRAMINASVEYLRQTYPDAH